MTAANRAGAMAVGALIAILLSMFVYDRIAPVYSDVSLTDVVQREQTVFGTLRFHKGRDCHVTPGSLVAFAHFVDVREPVQYVDKDGNPLKLRDLPASEEPYAITVGWRLSRSLPIPDALSVTFRGTCGGFERRMTLGPVPVSL